MREHAALPREAQGEDARSDADDVPAALALELALLRAHHAEALRAALSAAPRTRPPRERTLLRLPCVDGLPCSRIGETYRGNEGTSSRSLGGAREAILAEALPSLQRDLGVRLIEALTLARVLTSELPKSLRGLLAD